MNKARPDSKPTKPKLLVLELWGLGDLAMATPFLQAAAEKYEVTVVAKDYGRDLQPRFWPTVNLICSNLPWTAFRKKYHLWRWPWKSLFQLVRQLRREKFDYAVSARWDPRDHLLMWVAGARRRIGFPRVGSQVFLTSPLIRVPGAHRYEAWRNLGKQLGLPLPQHKDLAFQKPTGNQIVIHTGGSQPSKIWPLKNFQILASQLRQKNLVVQVVCDATQREWWLSHGEREVITAKTVSELIDVLGKASAFIGNDSGPGHVAAIRGLPTLSIFGPSIPEEFAPLHPRSEWIEGKPCAYKPCKDYCRFDVPNCLYDISPDEVVSRVEQFLARNLA